MDIKTKLMAARLHLTSTAPYLAPIAYRMPIIVTEKIGATAACDARGRIYFHPQFAESLPFAQLVGVMHHEVLHFVYAHVPRMDGRDRELFNVAADVVINEQIVEAGGELPSNGCFRAAFKVPAEHTTAEAVYDWLLQNAPQGAGGGMCATGATGDAEGDAAAAGEHGLDDVDADMARDEVAAAIGRHAGKVPGGLGVWADERTGPPRVNWRAKLGSLIARANNTFVRGRVQSDWRRVSRRSGAVGVHLPGRVQPVPRIACIIDTSGSMWGEGAAVLSEAMGIVQASGVAVDMLSCDAAAGRVVSVERLTDLRPVLTGGGGTDLQPAVDALAPVTRYSALVVFTDGYLPAVNVPAGPRVVWCITASGVVQDWMRGDVVKLTE